MGIVKNWQQPWTSPRPWWIHHFFIARAHVSHPIFIAKHPQTTQMRQGDKRLLHCVLFLSKDRPLCKYLYSSKSAATTACRPLFLPLTTHVPHKRVPKATRTCRGNMLLKDGKKWNDCWLLRVMKEYILLCSLITQPASHPCSFLFTSRHNNQPFEIWNRMLGSNLSSVGTGWLRREHSLGPTTWHSWDSNRAVTRQTSGNKGC